jgi:MFS family permease
MLGVMVVPAVLYGLLSFAIPENPRFLISIGHHEQARRILEEVEGDGTDLDARVTEIETALRREERSTFADLRAGGFFFKPIVWVGIGLSIFQQFVGINVAFYYSSTLWQSVGVDPTDSFFYSFTTSIINIVGTMIAMVFVDRVGRRPLAIVGSVGMAAALALEAWAFSAGSADGGLPAGQGWVALIAAHAFVHFFALSWGVIVWVMLGEMFPNRIRAAALGVAASAQWIANWAITASFPSLADWNLSGTYVIYTLFAALSIPFVLKFVKETKGKALEEMGRIRPAYRGPERTAADREAGGTARPRPRCVAYASSSTQLMSLRSSLPVVSSSSSESCFRYSRYLFRPPWYSAIHSRAKVPSWISARTFFISARVASVMIRGPVT